MTEHVNKADRLAPPEEGTTVKVAAENQPGNSAADRANVIHEGSLTSHLLYGLAAVILVLPMLVPGMSMYWLTICYGCIFAGAAVGVLAWGIVGHFRGRHPGR